MSHSASSHDRPKRVLLVDDDRSALNALATMLESEGFEVTPANNFEDARSWLRRFTFEVLITDVRLGAYNGLQLAVVARNSEPSTSLIVISGFDDSVLRAEAEQLGAAYLVKPIELARLLELVHAA